MIVENIYCQGSILGYEFYFRSNVYQIIGNVISWVIVAPVLDIVIYAEPANLVFTQGVVAAVSNAVSAGVIGTILLTIYSKTRSKKGSLTKE